MYLTGKKFFTFDSEKREEDGYEVEQIEVKIGYWRKHPNLHGYIVETFAEGKDECQEIRLDLEEIEKIVAAIKAGELPVTEGFFFGESPSPEKEKEAYEEQLKEDLEIFASAVAWLAKISTGDKTWRSVSYRASW